MNADTDMISEPAFSFRYICVVMAVSFVFFHSNQYKWVLSLGYGIFLYLFLLIFLPFGVSNYNPEHEYTVKFLLEIGLFVPITILSSLLNEFGLKPIFKKHSSYSFVLGWSIWSFIFLGSIIFLVYNYLGDWHDWQWSSFPGFVLNTLAVLAFPAAGVFFYFQFRRLQLSYDTVLTNSGVSIDEKQMILFEGEGAKDKISIMVSDFIFARAQDNYIEIHYLKNQETAKFLIRSTLSALQNRLEYDFLVRCHRSFLVNLFNVHSIKGNMKDMKITMNHSKVEISVSRTYISITLDRLKEYKRFQ